MEGLWVIAFAAGGLVINTFAALLLRSHGHDLNLRAAFLHLVGDAATSFGVMLSGIVVYYTDWSYADPIVSILVSVWITRQAVRIIRATVNVLMEGTPEGVEFAEVDAAIRAVGRESRACTTCTSGPSRRPTWLCRRTSRWKRRRSPSRRPCSMGIKQMLARDFGIGHVTLELEPAGGECAGSTCVLVPQVLNPPDEGHAGHHH